MKKNLIVYFSLYTACLLIIFTNNVMHGHIVSIMSRTYSIYLPIIYNIVLYFVCTIIVLYRARISFLFNNHIVYLMAKVFFLITSVAMLIFFIFSSGNLDHLMLILCASSLFDLVFPSKRAHC